MNDIAVICTGALGLLLFSLGLAVSGLRCRERMLAGWDPHPEDQLAKFVRAHGNTAEYVPFLGLLFLYLGSRDPSDQIVWLIVAVTACRYLLVIGLIAWPSMAKPNPFRFIGAIGTYLFGTALCIALLKTI